MVEVDASDSGVGGVLSQRSASDQKLHPCTFFSHCLPPAERNYDVAPRSETGFGDTGWSVLDVFSVSLFDVKFRSTEVFFCSARRRLLFDIYCTPNVDVRGTSV